MPIPIGAQAPDFTFLDAGGQTRSLDDFRGAPVILLFAPRTERVTQPVLQYLTLEDERVPVIAARGDGVVRQYGLETGYAVFVVDSRHRVIWRQLGSDGAPSTASPTAGLGRREFLASLLAASLATMVATPPASAASGTAAEPTSAPADQVNVNFTVNGRAETLTLDARVTLLDALREHLRLAGTKKGCDHGQCGACTVHIGNRRVLSCLTLAAAVSGASITTIEGLARGGELHPLQQAFIEQDAFQCGYCTSGQIMSAAALLDEPCGPTDDEVREGLSGNICRCGAYQGIVAAVQSVRAQRK